MSVFVSIIKQQIPPLRRRIRSRFGRDDRSCLYGYIYQLLTLAMTHFR